jgi:hypothetical protein
MAKLPLVAVKVMPIPQGVAVPFVTQHLDRETGAFQGTEAHAKAAAEMLDELHRWAGALKPLHSPKG